jgi:hypothetical protein|tara:strand:+ start:339 stop:608 length:270 start_codon:yes stop_codon:yes gene_type:complete
MCFGGGGGGPSESEQKAAAEQRIEAEDAKRAEVEKRAKQKREDITEALESRTADAGKRGGTGRRSLFTRGTGMGARSGGSAGFLGRFNR